MGAVGVRWADPMELITYPDRDLLMMSLADRIASELGQALRMAGRASLCVPGGTTPGPVFKTLAEVDLAWHDIAVFLNDERWLGEDSPRSNTRLLKETLLQSKASKAKLIPLFNGANTPEEGIPDLTDGLLPHLPITVLLLGMGADMHTASLSRWGQSQRGPQCRCAAPDGDAGRKRGRAADHLDRPCAESRAALPYLDHRA